MTTAGLDFDCDETELDKTLDPAQIKSIETLTKKRINQRIPVAYLVNKAWFAGLKFYVDERVLIPRSPIAELVTSQFTPWLSYPQVKLILDIGTGSACIAIACAYAFPDAIVDAVDVDDDAIQVANKNVSMHDLGNRVNIIKSDLFEKLGSNKYDLIISNPPYVGNVEMQSLPEEYRHEPGHALEAANNGLELVEQILDRASQYLNDEGLLVVEVGNSMEAVIDYFPDVPFTWLEFENGGQGVFLINKKEL